MGFIIPFLSLLSVIYGLSIETGNITLHDNYKILQALTGRMEDMKDNLNNLFDVVSNIEEVFDCGKPTLLNGHFDGNSTYAHSIMVASCNEGYIVHGNGYITCTADGVWTKLPECTHYCKSPSVPNSRQYNEDKKYPLGSEVTIQCNHGYEIYEFITSTEMTCVGSNLWSKNVKCNRIGCESPRVYNSRHYNEDMIYRTGTELTIQCNQGYKIPIHMSSVMTCIEPDVWSPAIVKCERYDCGILSPVPNGRYNSNDTVYNTTLTVICDDGFVIVGSEPSYCDENGQWVGGQRCSQRICIQVDDTSTECFLKLFEILPRFGDGQYTLYDIDEETCITRCLHVGTQCDYITTYESHCELHKEISTETSFKSTGINTFIRENMLASLSNSFFNPEYDYDELYG